MDVQKVLEHPTVAHVMRTNARFNNRLGNEFAGAVTYFSVLAMVPVLMFAFAVAGMILTQFRPELLTALQDSVVGLLGSAPEDVRASISQVIEDAANNWAGIGIVGLVSLAYAGSRLIKYLKSAVRAQLRPDFDQVAHKPNVVVELLSDLGILLLLLVAVAVTFGLASLATSMTDTVLRWLSLENQPFIRVLTRILSPVVSLIAGWLLFLFLFWVLPQDRPRTKVVLLGAVIGSVALGLLQYFAGALVGSFLNNPAAALFGPVIVVLLFANLFARVILMVAAWVATDNQPAVAHKWTPADQPLVDRDDVVVADERHWAAAHEDRIDQDIAKADAKLSRTHAINQVKGVLPGLSADPAKEKKAFEDAVDTRLKAASGDLDPRTEQNPAPAPTADAAAPDRYAAVDGRKYFAEEFEPVEGRVAERRTRLGYAAGLATGSGIGALVTLVLGRLLRR